MTITDFLLARIAEDEAALIPVVMPVLRGKVDQSWLDQFREPRGLRECEAKRRIVADHRAYFVDECCATCGSYDGAGSIEGDWPCTTLAALAAVYADHPDYQPEWAPEWAST